jgi:uncharacterized protein YqjF (DUF2071 family)
MPQTERIFLSADWHDLVMLNYEVDPELLQKHVPAGTVLDSFNGKTFVSMVGFRFCNTKLFGSLPVPFHGDFDEVNLRFYVRRKNHSEHRRGVVFITEIVPRQAIATTARLVYGENYVCLPMRHRVTAADSKRTAEYQWKIEEQWCALSAEVEGAPRHPEEGSLEQYITEHFWGYSRQRNGGCLEYHVTHEPWRIWSTNTARFEGDVSALYGVKMADTLKRRPDSAFLAEGSPVAVYKGVRIP